MPITYRHDINPLISGAAAFIGGHGQAQKAEADWRANEIQQKRSIAAQMQQATMQQFGNIAQSQLAANNQIRLQNNAHANAVDMLGREEQVAFGQTFLRQTGMPYPQAKQQYQQMVQGEMQSLGIDPSAGPTVEAAAFQPSMSFDDYVNQVTTKRAAAMHGQSLAQGGLEEVNPHEDKIKAAEAQLSQIEMEPLFDENERAVARQSKIDEINRLRSAPRIVRPRDAGSYSFDEDMQKGRVKQLPNGGYVGRNPRTGGWEEIVRAPSSSNSAADDALVGSLMTGQPMTLPDGSKVNPIEQFKKQGVKSIKVGNSTINFDDNADSYTSYLDRHAQARMAAVQAGLPDPGVPQDPTQWALSTGRILNLPGGQLATTDKSIKLGPAPKTEEVRNKLEMDDAAAYEKRVAFLEGQKQAQLKADPDGSLKIWNGVGYSMNDIYAGLEPERAARLKAKAAGQDPYRAGAAQSQPAVQDQREAKLEILKQGARAGNPVYQQYLQKNGIQW